MITCSDSYHRAAIVSLGVAVILHLIFRTLLDQCHQLQSSQAAPKSTSTVWVSAVGLTATMMRVDVIYSVVSMKLNLFDLCSETDLATS